LCSPVAPFEGVSLTRCRRLARGSLLAREVALDDRGEFGDVVGLGEGVVCAPGGAGGSEQVLVAGDRDPNGGWMPVADVSE